MAYSTDYNDIIKMFVMPDKPTDPFNPAKDDFLKLVEYALRKAFADFNFRTLTKTEGFGDTYSEWEKNRIQDKKHDNSLSDATVTNYLIERLAGNGFLKQFKEYFLTDAKEKKDFDNWHNITCQNFLSILNEEPQLYKNLQYGKAQKIVNMMLKHLYCLKGADGYSDKFKHCHMPLDSFTLEWFRREVAGKWYNSNKENKTKICVSSDKPNPKWSNISFKDDSLKFDYNCYDQDENRKKDDYYHYMFFVTMIRKYFDANDKNDCYGDLTPFQAEFYIWPEIQLRLCAENFIYQLDPDTYGGNSKEAKAAKQAIKDNCVDDLLKTVKDTINLYERR